MRCTISQIYSDEELCMFQTDLLSIIRSLNTVYTAIGICYTVMLTICYRGQDGTGLVVLLADSQHN